MRNVWLVARREIDVRTGTKAFRISLLVTLVVVAVGAALPGLLRSDDATTYTVAVSSSEAPLRSAVEAQARAQGVEVDFRDVTDLAGARTAVDDDGVDAAVVDGTVVGDSDTDPAVVLVRTAAAALSTTEQLRSAGLSDTQIAQALDQKPLPVTTVSDRESSARQGLAVIIVIFFFAQLITFCTWVGTGVVEEKTSRVVEVLLGAVRPVHLLAGKVLGIGAVALLQAVSVLVVGILSADLADTLSVPPSLYLTIVVGVVWFVLGFLFFASLAAALSSLVSHQEEVGSALSPMTILLFIAYAGSFAAAQSPDGLVGRLASIVPPFSSLAMPGRMASGGVPWWEVGLAVVLMLAATAGVLLGAGRLYRNSILHTGRKLSIGSAWRAEPVGR